MAQVENRLTQSLQTAIRLKRKVMDLFALEMCLRVCIPKRPLL